MPEYGLLNYDTTLLHLSAHCARHDDCAVQRSCKASDRPRLIDQGRPVGFLLAWLFAARQYKSAEKHMQLGKKIMQDSKFISLQKRNNAQTWAKTQESLKPVFKRKLERKKAER